MWGGAGGVLLDPARPMQQNRSRIEVSAACHNQPARNCRLLAQKFPQIYAHFSTSAQPGDLAAFNSARLPISPADNSFCCYLPQLRL